MKRSQQQTRLVIVAMVAAISVAACGDDAEEEGGSTPSDSTEIAPSDTLGAGELIVFERAVSGAEDPDLYAVEPGGGEPILLRSESGAPHWSPDGRVLAFGACLNPPDCDAAVALMERSTGEVHGLSMPDPDLFTFCVIWSPSGEKLACEGLSDADEARNGVYTIRASDGGGLERITTNPAGDDIPLAFSPDGSQLLLYRSDPSREEPSNDALFVAPISGGQPHRITPWGLTDDYADWSPDGSTIVFESEGSLYRVNPDGAGLAEIALEMPEGSSADSAFDVSFSPDGARILFSVGGLKPGLYTARPDGRDVLQLTSTPTEDHHANWGAAPDA